jgi:hypothetical protein
MQMNLENLHKALCIAVQRAFVLLASVLFLLLVHFHVPAECSTGCVLSLTTG